MKGGWKTQILNHQFWGRYFNWSKTLDFGSLTSSESMLTEVQWWSCLSRLFFLGVKLFHGYTRCFFAYVSQFSVIQLKVGPLLKVSTIIKGKWLRTKKDNGSIAVSGSLNGWDRWYIITQLAVVLPLIYHLYILPIGRLYATKPTNEGNQVSLHWRGVLTVNLTTLRLGV